MTANRAASAVLVALTLALQGCSERNPVSVHPDPPVVHALAPDSAAAGEAAFTLVVTGNRFVEGSRVRADGQERATTFVSGTELHAEITATDIASPGTVRITVLNPGRGGESAERPLRVVAAHFVPVPAGGILSAGREYSCAVGADGAVYCWGGSFYPGDPMPAVKLAGPGFQRVSVAANSARGCALDAAGQAYCWGFTLLGSQTPRPVAGALLFTDIAVGEEHACAVTTEGRVYCWGNGYHGQLGDGRHGMPGSAGPSSDEPVAIHSDVAFAAVTSGGAHSCALSRGGRAYCWGSTGRGALGNGETRPAGAIPDVRPPVPVLGGHTFAVLSAGSGHSCGLTTAGAAYCWGENEAAQLGNGSEGYSASASTPVAVALGQVYAQISAGHQHTCAVRTDGQVFCWGRNHLGQLGTGASTPGQATPSPVVGGGSYVHVSAGLRHSCALTADGTAHCWGHRGFGALGNGTTSYRPEPVPTASLPHAVAITAGERFHCALAQEGTAWCWGSNGGFSGTGQLGTGSFAGPDSCITDNLFAYIPVPCSPRPVRVAAGGASFVALTAGAAHACALTAEGAVYCWGANAEGQLGDGTTTDRSAPILVPGAVLFAAIAAGRASTCGLTRAGEAYCWGRNFHGQLGDGSTTRRLTPVAVSGSRLYVAITGGGEHTCALDAAGAVYCWGANGTGQLGATSGDTCTFTDRGQSFPVPCSQTPIRAGTSVPAVAVNAGSAHTCALQADGTAHCWGMNASRRLGVATAEYCPTLYTTVECSRTPLPVTAIPALASISAGAAHTCGIAHSRQAYCWGSPEMGALGRGIETGFLPGPVAGGLAFTALASGYQHACGLVASGAVYCWGSAILGEAGDGEHLYHPWPSAVLGVRFSLPAVPGR